MPATDKHSKTEKPTAKRKKEARKEGRIARSPDIAAWASLLLGSYLLPWFLHTSEGRLLGLMSQVQDVIQNPSVPSAMIVLESGLRIVLLTALPFAGIFALFAIVTSLAQTRGAVSTQNARPKLSRISPREGFRRVFGPNMLMQLARQLLKLVALSGIAYSALMGLMHEMIGKAPVSLLPILAALASSVDGFLRLVAGIGVGIGIIDYAYQRRKTNEGMKMTKDEVKDEAKSSMGDPHVRGMVRKRMYQIARSQVRNAVRQADVVVTNPTHYAVALQYDAARSAAPRVLAKGADLLAGRIRDEAATWSIPVVEDPPLARYLYAVCDVDQPIPPEIYLAVAKVLAFVYALPAMVRGGVVHHPAPSIVPAEPAALATLSETQRERVQAVLAGAGR